ncbi:MAG: queuosine precursor transporter [Candidatus Gastranaerophilaceae bacterium]
MNETLFFTAIIVNFLGVTLAYKLFSKTGIYAWVALATVIANIEVVKCVDIFGLPLTLGNVTYGSIFLATDILNEKYGREKAQKGVFLGFFSLLVLTLFTQIDLLYIPSSNDFAQGAMQTIFALTPRICLGSMLAYLVSNTMDVFLYKKIRDILPSDKFLWVRNNAATMTSQLVDTILFTFIAFFGVFPLSIVLKLCFTTYVLKLIIAVCDTPFLYLAKRINNDEQIKEN